MAREVSEFVRRRLEALDLFAGECRIVVRGGEMRHQPDDLGRRRRQLREAVAAHAGVELQVDPHPLRDLAVGDRELETGGTRLRDLAVRPGRSQHDDALGAVLVPQREAITPVRTSPVPAVASAGVPASQTNTPSPGATTSVPGPLRRTTQR